LAALCSKKSDTSPGGVLKKYKIAVIEGDGIGREVVPEGIRVLEAAGRRFDIGVAWTHFDWSCDRYLKTGKMMPEDGLDQLRAFDAIYLGAIGSPKVADHISLWGLLIPIRRTFQQYVNLRPARLLPGIETPLKNYRADEIDFCIVRENNEGEYSEIGGRLFRNTDAELVIQESVFTRRGCDRVLRYAFELARKRKKHVTSATKSNGIAFTMPFWDERFAGSGIANPVAQIWSGAMMLGHLGEAQAAGVIEKAIRCVLADSGPETPDLGGKASARELGEAIRVAVEKG